MELDPPSSPGPETSTGLPANLSAALACLFHIVGGIVFLIIEKKNSFVRFYAMQSIFFSGAWILLEIATKISLGLLVVIPLIGWIFRLLLALALLVITVGGVVIYIMTMVKAFSGVEWEIPVIGPLARKQLASA